MAFTFQIEPRRADLGGGWHLHLFEDHVEVGGGVFPQEAMLAAKTLTSPRSERVRIGFVHKVEQRTDPHRRGVITASGVTAAMARCTTLPRKGTLTVEKIRERLRTMDDDEQLKQQGKAKRSVSGMLLEYITIHTIQSSGFEKRSD